MEATADEVATAGKLVVQLHRHEILLLWNNGEPVALSNVCIHRGRKLNEGVMLGTRLVCAGHQWAYETTTGFCKARERYQPRYSAGGARRPDLHRTARQAGPRDAERARKWMRAARFLGASRIDRRRVPELTSEITPSLACHTWHTAPPQLGG